MTAAVWALGGLVAGAFCGGVATYAFLAFGRSAGDESTDDDTLGQRALIDTLGDALVVLDETGTVRMANEAFERAFGDDVTGASIESVFADLPALQEQLRERSNGVVEVTVGEDPTYYEVAVSPVEGERTALVVFHDVTQHERQRAALEAKNERLDQFASFISHDLRNPLDVAIGRTNAVFRMNDDPELDPHVEKVQNSLERMHRIITDVLALARKGDEIGDQDWTQLDTVAGDAWDHVDTESASLTVERDLTLLADRDSLTHVFENLFRNAVEHAGSDVAVRTGPLESGEGFFVADDGEGIPPGDRDRLLEAGTSGSSSGTGLGLAIVSTIVEAHGWDLRITDSEDGGARFEFTGVELAPGELATAGQ